MICIIDERVFRIKKERAHVLIAGTKRARVLIRFTKNDFLIEIEMKRKKFSNFRVITKIILR